MLSNLGYDYATEKKNKEEETEIPWETVTPDTLFVSPNDVDKLNSQLENGKNTTENTLASQTNNRIANKTKTPDLVPDKTNNIKNIQPREGRPNK